MMTKVFSALARGLSEIRWYVHEFFGDNAYERYVARHRIEHPDHPPMCERDFWRKRDRDAEDLVQTGCC
ncbi:YbdD/YjiX family protein [Arcanobacterium ihumii]|uniref:YbdD/YjiX family protein n=1 Tax=Arcanobacterium ihumii TaxID=2138162 RepID=UPI000F54210C|nr:YbdD/YjiX family protein [Arcanobacterium ihumii]